MEDGCDFLEYKAPRFMYRVIGEPFGPGTGETNGKGVVQDCFFKFSAIIRARLYVRSHLVLGIDAFATVFDSTGRVVHRIT